MRIGLSENPESAAATAGNGMWRGPIFSTTRSYRSGRHWATRFRICKATLSLAAPIGSIYLVPTDSTPMRLFHGENFMNDRPLYLGIDLGTTNSAAAIFDGS